MVTLGLRPATVRRGRRIPRHTRTDRPNYGAQHLGSFKADPTIPTDLALKNQRKLDVGATELTPHIIESVRHPVPGDEKRERHVICGTGRKLVPLDQEREIADFALGPLAST